METIRRLRIDARCLLGLLVFFGYGEFATDRGMAQESSRSQVAVAPKGKEKASPSKGSESEWTCDPIFEIPFSGVGMPMTMGSVDDTQATWRLALDGDRVYLSYILGLGIPFRADWRGVKSFRIRR